MLTAIENLKETMKRDGHPDRFVNQYEFLHVLLPDLYYMGNRPRVPGAEGYDQYGVFWRYREGQMGPCRYMTQSILRSRTYAAGMRC